MENVRPMRWALPPLVFACATVALMAGEAAAQTNSSPSWWQFGQSPAPAPAPTPPAGPTDDPVSLKTQPKVGVELYVSVANLYVHSGKYPEAEEQYKKAMKLAPNDLRVLLGFAMLKDQMKQPDEALKYYQKAAEKHPKEPSVYNNLAIHYAKFGMDHEAIEAAQNAVDLRPREPRYRDNLAALLVEAGMPQEAFRQLREVYDEPVAHYDLGFLLNKRGIKSAASQEFSIALRLNPNMGLARQWVERLALERGDVNPAAVATMPPGVQPPMVVSPDHSYQRDQLPPAPMMPPQFAAPPQYSNLPPQIAGPPQNSGLAPPPGQRGFPLRRSIRLSRNLRVHRFRQGTQVRRMRVRNNIRIRYRRRRRAEIPHRFWQDEIRRRPAFI